MADEKKSKAMESNSYLSFRIGGELFAAHVSRVLSIMKMGKITKVPLAPDYMLGVINLRGMVLPVIDARIKFGMQVDDNQEGASIIVNEVVINNEEVKVGTVVDKVEEVMEVNPEDIGPPPGIGNHYQADFITGVIKQNESFIMVLDMDKVYATADVSMLSDYADKQSEETTNA